MRPYEVAIKALNFEETDRVPVVLWVVGQTYAPMAGIPDNEYYADPDKMLEAQVQFYERVPNVFTVPGIWPDLGAMAELGALGCTLEFPRDAPPYLRQSPITDISKIDTLQVPDPRKADYTSQVLDYLKYFIKHLPDKLRSEFGFLDGHLFCGGPGEIAALLLGYDQMFYAMFDRPELVHELLRKVTEFIKSFLQAQMEIVGPAKRLCVWDHLPGMLSKEMYLGFVHPYLSEIFALASEAEIKVYHNENNYPHLLEAVKELPANVCHVGPKHHLPSSKQQLRKCVMGNIHPIEVMLNGNPAEIRECCRRIIKEAGRGGGLWLSTGGGLAPETPLEHIRILVETAQETPVSG